MTLVVNLFGGPGTGKSTTCAGTFYNLKQKGFNVEQAHEYAKDLTWENRKRALSFQPYVAAKQIWRVHRLLGEVEAVITDSPILLSNVYGGEGFTPAFEAYVLDTFRSWNTLNIFLTRDPEAHPYNPKGRNQTEEEAQKIDDAILTMLDRYNINRENVQMGEQAAEVVANMVWDRL